MSTNDIKMLMTLKDEIENAKERIAKEEGKISATMERLKKEFNLTSIQKAEEHVDKLEKQINKKQSILNKEINKIKEEFNL